MGLLTRKYIGVLFAVSFVGGLLLATVRDTAQARLVKVLEEPLILFLVEASLLLTLLMRRWGTVAGVAVTVLRFNVLHPWNLASQLAVGALSVSLGWTATRRSGEAPARRPFVSPCRSTGRGWLLLGVGQPLAEAAAIQSIGSAPDEIQKLTVQVGQFHG